MRFRWSLPFLTVLACAGVASAHGQVGSRFDAPIPLWLLLSAAGLTVALTAGYLAIVRADARTERHHLVTLSPGLARIVRAGARGLFLTLFVASILAGLLGRQVPTENLATVFVWPLWFKGVAVVSVLVGSPWRVLSPWRTVYDGLRRIEGDDLALASYPAWLATWPALVGFVVLVGVVENLTVIPRDPSSTVGVVGAYALVMVLGGVAFGPTWFQRADAFEVLYDLFGRVAPVRVTRTDTDGYDLALDAPWDECTRPVSDLALGAFVVAIVYTVSYDGLKETPEYQSLSIALRDTTGLGPVVDLPLYLFGLLAFLALFALVALATGRESVRSSIRALAPSVLPIAVAYELAHNVDYVLINAGQFATVVGRYVDAAVTVDPLAWLSVPAFWGAQVVLVVVGHVVAVVAAHAIISRAGRPMRAHVPLTAAMVGYTILSLWIISRPVVA